MKALEGKKALITGGSKGIGAGIVRKFVDEGASVIFSYRSSEEEAKKLVDELEEYGSIRAIKSDASDISSAEELVNQVKEIFGGLDVLVNNAGITQDNLLLRMSEEQWDNVINTNLKSVFNLTKNALKLLMRSGSGSIVNIASVVGITGNAGQSNYAASKAGIIGFSKSIAKEMGSRNLRCNVIAPGFVSTEMTAELSETVREKYLEAIPLKRFGSVEEIANCAVFLGSERSSYISGQVISVCGALNT